MMQGVKLGHRIAFATGLLLLASGVLHVFVWWVEGSSLSGPISWRKPILFGLSAGVTVISLAWVAGKTPTRFGDSLLLTAFSLSMLGEVGLITMQQWRGAPSHFNRSTPFDATVLWWIEMLIVFATIVIAEFTRRSFGKLQASSDIALAIRGGMSLLLFSCGLGFLLVYYGNQQVATGASPELFGAAGVMKFPHGAPMHAIQALPMFAWLLMQLKVDERDRFNSIAFALSSIVTFTAFSLVQTFSGRARFDLTYGSAGLLLVTVLLAMMALQVVFSRVVFGESFRCRNPT